MQFIEQRSDNCIVLVAIGRIDNDTSLTFQGELLARVDVREANVVVDFAGVEYISSAGLRALLMAARKSKAENSRVVVAAPNEIVREIFAISRFSHVLDIFDSVPEALAALS